MATKRKSLKTSLDKERPLPKKIAVDILGVLLIIAAGLFGWLPGPGGIPLLVAGLSLLATNHEWARKLLDSIKQNGIKLADRVYKDHPLVKIAYDVIAVMIVILAGYIIGQSNGNIIQGLAVALGFLGFGLFLGNRHRIERLNLLVKRINRRN